jgi:OFA family oxalate/formate antiporter-like MFS transporter
LIFFAVTGDSPTLLAFAIIIYSVGMAGVPVMGSGFMARFFGPSHYQANLAVLNLIIIPAAFIGPSLMSLFIMATGSYANAMLVLATFGILAIVCTLVIRLMGRR